MEKRNDFVVANLLDAKMGSKAFFQEVQRRPLQPRDKVEGRQQRCLCPRPIAVQRAFTGLLTSSVEAIPPDVVVLLS
jgi:hypothetical protein